MNKQALEALPEDLQRIVLNACRVANHDMLAEYNARNNDALETLLNEHKVELRRYPQDVLDMAEPVLLHRMALTFAARARGDNLIHIINEFLTRHEGDAIAARSLRVDLEVSACNERRFAPGRLEVGAPRRC